MSTVPAMPVAMRLGALCGMLCSGLGGPWSARALSQEPQADASAMIGSENPYQTIASRNVFALKPPPPPPDPNAAPPPDLPQIKLQGISSLFGNRRVLVKLVEKARPGQPAKEEALILREGERYGDVEVVSIDPASGTVRFNNRGNEVVMTMANDAEKPPAGPPPAATAPAVAQIRAPQPMPVPTAGPGAPPPPIAAAAVVHPPAAGGSPGTPIPVGLHNPGAPAPPGGVVLAPGTTIAGNNPGQNPTPAPPQPPPLSREEQEILIEINRLRYQQEGDPRAKLLPPTSLSQPPPAPY